MSELDEPWGEIPCKDCGQVVMMQASGCEVIQCRECAREWEMFDLRNSARIKYEAAKDYSEKLENRVKALLWCVELMVTHEGIVAPFEKEILQHVADVAALKVEDDLKTYLPGLYV